jgi:hypothetical protein
MSLKLLMAVAAAPIVAFAQQVSAEPWKPTIEDAQKLVDAIGGDKDKLKHTAKISKLTNSWIERRRKATRRSSMSGSPNLIVSNRKWGLII